MVTDASPYLRISTGGGYGSGAPSLSTTLSASIQPIKADANIDADSRATASRWERFVSTGTPRLTDRSRYAGKSIPSPRSYSRRWVSPSVCRRVAVSRLFKPRDGEGEASNPLIRPRRRRPAAGREKGTSPSGGKMLLAERDYYARDMATPAEGTASRIGASQPVDRTAGRRKLSIGTVFGSGSQVPFSDFAKPRDPVTFRPCGVVADEVLRHFDLPTTRAVFATPRSSGQGTSFSAS